MKLCPVCSTEYPNDVKFCPNDGQTLRAAAPAADLVGQVVADRYHVVKKLGEGGMGQVYLAEHVKMGRRSAIKVMNPSMVHDPDAVSRFNREAANASRITHPNVCAIYDFGETSDGLIYLAMEFIEGEPLTEVLQREGALRPERATHIFLQVADALQAAHDLGIVHRDLKPDNIMLGRGRDGADVVKVVDFGIAKAIGGDDSQKVTKTGLVVGTPEYMSPEQLSGDKLDGRSDLYSLALVLYRMLTAKLPFEAGTAQETMIKRLTDEPTPLAGARPDLVFPPGLQPTLDAALARSPVERYQSVAKFAHDVAAVLGFQRAAGAPTPLPATRADAAGKTQLLEIAAPRAPSAPPPARAAKKRSLVPVAVGVLAVLGAGGGGWAIFGNRGGTAAAADSIRVREDTTGRTRNPAGSPGSGNPSAGGVGLAVQTRRDTTSHAAVEPSTPRVDVTRAGAALNTLLDSLDVYPAAFIRDSARVLYDAGRVSTKDRAMAAFLIGNTYFQVGDRARGCEWVRRAAGHDPSDPSYSGFVQTQCQG